MKARSIELKELPVTGEDGKLAEKPFAYRDGIKSVLRHDMRGYTAEDVLQSMSILGDLKGANGALILSQSDYEFLLDRVNKCQYVMATEELAAFITDMRAAPATEVEPTK